MSVLGILRRDYSDVPPGFRIMSRALLRRGIVVAQRPSRGHGRWDGGLVQVPGEDVPAGTAVKGGITPDMPILVRTAHVLDRQGFRANRVWMGMPLPQDLCAGWNLRRGPRGVDAAGLCPGACGALNHRTVDCLAVAIDVSEVLAIAGRRTVTFELPGDMCRDRLTGASPCSLGWRCPGSCRTGAQQRNGEEQVPACRVVR